METVNNPWSALSQRNKESHGGIRIYADTCSMMDEMSYFLTGSHESEWQGKENLWDALNETVWVAMPSVFS